MKLVKSVFREFHNELVFDPAENSVNQFNAILGTIDKDKADMLDMLAEQIMNVRLKQDNTFTEISGTGAMYHNRGRWDSGIVEENR